MIVAGIMSGTSADGIDVALTRITTGRDEYPKVKLLAHEAFPYPAALRKAVLAAMNSSSTSTAELGRLNWRLGMAYAEAVKTTLQRNPMKVALIGCHGQTLYHQATPEAYAGAKFGCTWQAGEAAVVAGEVGVPVVSNFRPADMVAGGQGAPLVPLLDFVMFRHPKRGRILLNLGGIANFTAIPPGATADQVLAFDCGPGNMVIDALMMELYGKRMDKNGAVAASGIVIRSVVERAIRASFFRKAPPKTAGREQFGCEYALRFLADCRKKSARNEDAIASATALTSATVTDAYLTHGSEGMFGAHVDFIVSGGGVRNLTLMRQLTELLEPVGCRVVSIDKFGIPAEAKEAAAFALLAWQTWHRRPGNLPSATGASRPVILGQVTYV